MICANVKTNYSKEHESSYVGSLIPFVEKQKQNRNNISYFYSNEPFCQELNIKDITEISRHDVPEKFEFLFILRDRISNHP